MDDAREEEEEGDEIAARRTKHCKYIPGGWLLPDNSGDLITGPIKKARGIPQLNNSRDS